MPRAKSKKTKSAKRKTVKKASSEEKPKDTTVNMAGQADTVVVVKKETAPKKVKGHKLKHTPGAEQWFILSSGKEIRNIRELAQDLGDMEDFVFGHHVNEHRNDFVNWIRDVFEDLELAEKISNHKDKKKMQITIYEHIVDKMW